MAENEDGPKTKLDEQATAKAELSYSYFLAKNASSPEPPPPPRLLSEEEAKMQIEAERQKSTQGVSLWNQAGTFEERSATAWAKERLTSMLLELSVAGVTVTSVNSITGDASIWMVRGKPRFGFAFEITLAWKADIPGGVEIRGTVKVPNADADDIDDLTLLPEVLHQQAERAKDEATALAQAQKLKAPIEKILGTFYEELKQRA